MANGRDTQASRLRRRTRASLIRRQRQLTPEQIQKKQQELLEQARQEAIEKFEKEREKKFEKTITSKEKQLNEIKDRIQEFIKERGRRPPGLDKQRRLLQDEIASLKRSKERDIPFEQASSFAVRRAKASEKQVESLPERIKSIEQQKELRQAGIDVGKLQRGTLKVEDLNAKQIDALERQGLIERTTVTQRRFTESGIEQTIRDLEKSGIKLSENAKENLRKVGRGEDISGIIDSTSQKLSIKSITDQIKKGDIDFSNLPNQKVDIEGIKIDFSKSPIQIGRQLKQAEKKLGRDLDIRDIAEAQGFKIRSEQPTGTVEFALTQPLSRKISEFVGSDGFGKDFLQRQIGNVDRFVTTLQKADDRFNKIDDRVLRNVVRNTLLPLVTIGASADEIENALQGELGQLKDSKGNFIFTPIQSERLGSLTTEVTLNLAAGSVIGKLASISRGAVLSKLPEGLINSNRFKNVIRGLDLTVLGSLTAVEAAGIAKTFKEEGEEAAILRLLGDVSFLRGFAKTGLRTDKQSIKEFRDLADKFKKISGKRGTSDPFALLRKKKKKIRDPFTNKIIEVTEEEFQELQRRVRGLIEKKLLNAKSLEEQYKILGELRKRLPTKTDKKNFDEFILELFEKGIIKGTTVEVSPGVKARVLGQTTGIKPIETKTIVPKTEKSVPLSVGGKGIHQKLADSKTLSELQQRFNTITTTEEYIQLPPSTKRNIQRIFNNRQKNLQRIELNQRNKQLDIQRNKLSLGERYKLAQRTDTRTKQQERLRNLSRFNSKTNQLERQIQKNRQKLNLRSKLSLKERQRLKLKQRVPERLRPKAKIPKFPKLPRIPLPASKKKPKKRKKPFAKRKEFNVFIKNPGGRKTGFKKLSKPLSKKQAERKLKKELETTLKASGFIADSKGKKIKPRVTKGFRLSKTNKNVLVEKRNRRLDTSGETKAIQKARKNKKPFKSKKKSKLKSTKLIKRRKK